MSILRYFITSKAKRSVLKLFLSHIGSAFYTREVARLTTEPLNAVRRELGYLEKAGLLRSYMQGNLKYYEVVKSFPVLPEWQKIILSTPNIDREQVTPSVHVAKPAGVSLMQPDEESVPDREEEEAVETGPVDSADIPGAASVQGEETLPDANGSERQPDIITISTIVNILKNEFKTINSITLAVVYGEAAFEQDIPQDGIDLLVVGDINGENLLKLLADIEDDTEVPINLVRMTRTDFDYRNAKGDPLIRRIWSEKKLVVKGRY